VIAPPNARTDLHAPIVRSQATERAAIRSRPRAEPASRTCATAVGTGSRIGVLVAAAAPSINLTERAETEERPGSSGGARIRQRVTDVWRPFKEVERAMALVKLVGPPQWKPGSRP
jgi:hypothetical protein